MENTDGMIGMFEPMCKIRFLSDPKPDEDYIAVPASEMIDLIADQLSTPPASRAISFIWSAIRSIISAETDAKLYHV